MGDHHNYQLKYSEFKLSKLGYGYKKFEIIKKRITGEKSREAVMLFDRVINTFSHNFFYYNLIKLIHSI